MGDLRSEWREFDHVLCFKSEHSWHEHCTLLVVVLLLVLVILALVACIWFDTLVVLKVLSEEAFFTFDILD